MNKNNNAQNYWTYAFHICRALHKCSYTMMAKPMKTLSELHHLMISSYNVIFLERVVLE